MHCKSIHVYLFIRKMPLTKPVRDLMLFLPSDNIFKFSEIIDSYLLFKKKGLFTELKIIEWGEQVSKAFITIYGYKLLELNKTMKFKKLFKFLKFHQQIKKPVSTQSLKNPLKYLLKSSVIYLLKPFKLAIFSMQFVDNDNFLKVNQIFKICS